MGLMASTHVHMLTTDLVTWTLSKHTHNKSTNILAHAFFHSFSDEYAPHTPPPPSWKMMPTASQSMATQYKISLFFNKSTWKLCVYQYSVYVLVNQKVLCF